MQLDKQIITVMKGYAIMFIALHNFLHIKSFTGFVQENENTFDVSRTWDYLNTFHTFELTDIGQFFSFLGWIGLPVFLFVSGYGLVKKYENTPYIDINNYLLHSWKKLMLLLLPASLFFVTYSVMKGTWGSVIPKTVLQLSLLYNFTMPALTISPGVFWYFGLAFELYALYILLRRLNTNCLAIALGGAILLQVITVAYFGPKSPEWSWVRHNFIGWCHIFILGMIVAKSKIETFLFDKTLYLLLCAIVCIVLLPVSLLNMWSWLVFAPYIALLFFVCLAGVVKNIRRLQKIGMWLGSYSAFIFVGHPIARMLLMRFYYHINVPLWLVTTLYIILFFMIAMAYKPIYIWLMSQDYTKILKRWT